MLSKPFLDDNLNIKRILDVPIRSKIMSRIEYILFLVNDKGFPLMYDVDVDVFALMLMDLRLK